jgi:mannose-6-phosphate isomerase-like protein (cupin superfamily)
VAVGNLNVGVGVVHRSAKAAQASIAHDELTEIYHILAGSGTLVTGGALTKPERFPADSQTVKELAGPSMRGTGLENGVSRTVRAGDVVIIPAGTGHWFSSIDGAIDYEVMRIDPGKLLSLK